VTHTLHRQGSEEGLAGDYVVFAIAAQGVNAEGAAGKFQRFLEIVRAFNPINVGDMRTGNIFAREFEDIVNGTRDNSIVHAVFSDLGTVTRVLAKLKEADLGLSIVLSGLFDGLSQCCRDSGVGEHTAEHSLGVWGRVERLPAPGVLAITTMCGHGMIAFGLVQDLASQVRAGRLTPEEGARILAHQCHCGVFNPVRGANLLSELAAAEAHDKTT